MTTKPKILAVSDSRERGEQLRAQFDGVADIVIAEGMLRALARLKREEFDGVYVGAAHFQDAFQIGKLLQNERILEGMPDGVVLLDSDNTIIWGNGRLREWSGRESVIGANFYAVLGSPEILGPDFCPFHTALATGLPSSSTLRSGDNRYYRVHATPVREGDGPIQHLIVTVRDLTTEILQQQKLAAIHRAGIELANLTPDELFHMSVEDRIELLKSNILHYTKDLLNFDVVEIRLLDAETGKLEPLLAVGMEPAAAGRVLFASMQGNGVTGYVAATGKSYQCENTVEDPLFLEGSKDAKSSLTVPLILHDEVIGTFNVESPDPRAFTESDLQFLEIFTRDVANALNTLELLVAERAGTTAESVEAMHSAVALPVDDILNAAVNIMERYIGHEPEVAEHVKRILRNARDIKQVIQSVGQKMSPSQAVPQSLQHEERPLLKSKQVLVADADESVRSAAHALLERYGCIVETAHDGAEAVFMARNTLGHSGYDVIIADIRLPDMSGYDLMLKLQDVLDVVPLVLMTGYGYDPGHSIVNARRAGLPADAVLSKPFRLDQLLDTVEKIILKPKAVKQA
ncbi:MAG: response regulator [Planctomycetaceae bacterium]|nr:response regulator [Planctomycetaceae bacterium]